jgi:hypothetical protein
VSSVRELVEQLMEDTGVSMDEAVESVAATLDITPAEVMQEFGDVEDELRGDEPPEAV